MPALIGLQQAAAEQVIRHAGLQLESAVYEYPGNGVDSVTYRRIGVGNVISQEPGTGTLIQRGARIKLAVAVSPQVTEIPITRSVAQ